MCVWIFLYSLWIFLNIIKNEEKWPWYKICHIAWIRWNVSMNSKECVKNIMNFDCRTVFYVWTINCRLLTFIRMFLLFLFLYSPCSLLNRNQLPFYYRVSIVFVLLLFHPFKLDSFFCSLPLFHAFSSPLFSVSKKIINSVRVCQYFSVFFYNITDIKIIYHPLEVTLAPFKNTHCHNRTRKIKNV